MTTEQVPSEIRALSQAWITGVDADALMRILSCDTPHQAYVRICRYRNDYGLELFPHRKAAMATGGYSQKKVNKVATMWKNKASNDEIADFLGCSNPDSVWGIISMLRTQYGKEKFPYRRAAKRKKVG